MLPSRPWYFSMDNSSISRCQVLWSITLLTSPSLLRTTWRLYLSDSIKGNKASTAVIFISIHVFRMSLIRATVRLSFKGTTENTGGCLNLFWPSGDVPGRSSKNWPITTNYKHRLRLLIKDKNSLNIKRTLYGLLIASLLGDIGNEHSSKMAGDSVSENVQTRRQYHRIVLQNTSKVGAKCWRGTGVAWIQLARPWFNDTRVQL